MATARDSFQSLYRIARIAQKHKVAGAALMDGVDAAAMVRVLRLRFSSRRLFSVEACNVARRSGYSYRKAITLNLKAARYRQATGYCAY